LCEEQKVEASFQKTEFLNRVLGRKLVFLIDEFILGQHPYL